VGETQVSPRRSNHPEIKGDFQEFIDISEQQSDRLADVAAAARW
jgi:hypothetical protein